MFLFFCNKESWRICRMTRIIIRTVLYVFLVSCVGYKLAGGNKTLKTAIELNCLDPGTDSKIGMKWMSMCHRWILVHHYY